MKKIKKKRNNNIWTMNGNIYLNKFANSIKKVYKICNLILT